MRQGLDELLSQRGLPQAAATAAGAIRKSLRLGHLHVALAPVIDGGAVHLEQVGDLMDGLAAVQGQQSDGSLVHAHVGDVLELLAQDATLTWG